MGWDVYHGTWLSLSRNPEHVTNHNSSSGLQGGAEETEVTGAGDVRGEEGVEEVLLRRRQGTGRKRGNVEASKATCTQQCCGASEDMYVP